MYAHLHAHLSDCTFQLKSVGVGVCMERLGVGRAESSPSRRDGGRMRQHDRKMIKFA